MERGHGVPTPTPFHVLKAPYSTDEDRRQAGMFPCKHWLEMRSGEWKHSILGFRTRRLRNSPGLLESAVFSQGCDRCGPEQGSPTQAKADPSPF